MGIGNTGDVHKTTETAIEVLDSIRRANGASVSDLLSEFDISRSVLYAHLNTLAQNGFIVRENGQYWVGARLKEFSVAATKRKPSYQIVKNKIQKLEEEIEAEMEFLVEEGGQVHVIYHSESINHERTRLYMHNTAAGKAVLAEMSEERVHGILDQYGLPEQTEKTITDREKLLEKLETITERGYAYNNSECFEGYHGIGMTVEDISGSVLGAITVGGPVYHISKRRLQSEMVDTLQKTVDDIEESIDSQRSVIISELAKE